MNNKNRSIIDLDPDDDPNNWTMHVHPDDRQRVIERWVHCVEHEPKEYQIENRFVHRDGTMRHALCHITPDKDDAGVVRQYYITRKPSPKNGS